MARLTKPQVDRVKRDLNTLIGSGPDGISEFLVLIQGPIRFAVEQIEDAENGLREKLGDEDVSCNECGQSRPLTHEERAARAGLRDAADQLEYYSRELERTIDTFAEFDPDWLKGE